MGGNNAAGAGLKGRDAPASVAVASNRVNTRIIVDLIKDLMVLRQKKVMNV